MDLPWDFFSDKEQKLDKNYKIPKKIHSDSSCEDDNSDSASVKTIELFNEIKTPQTTPLANLHHHNNQSLQNYDDTPIVHNRDTTIIINNAVFKNLDMCTKEMEKPKNLRQNIFEQAVPDLLDETIPKSLKLLFQPLYCKLCTAQLSSNQTAKIHYSSKNHEKKIRKWLIEWSESTGEPLHPRASTTGIHKTEDVEKNPQWFHCDVCDLELTGRIHAESHYMGKHHQKALIGYKPPAGPGFYDEEGKWVRIKNSKCSKIYDFEKDDNFGNDFKRNRTTEMNETTMEPVSKKLKETASKSNNKFHCEICDVYTTCQEQLEHHVKGQKHTKKLKQYGLKQSVEELVSFDVQVPVVNLDPNASISLCRTPSGDYYCPTCNLTTNSEFQFLQHLKSKGHAKKMLQKSNIPK